MHEYAHYIGIPFAEKGRTRHGVDCWGLCRLILAEQFGIAVPSYTEDYATTIDAREISMLINQESLGMTEVAVPHAQPGDIAILRLAGRPWHCALMIDPPWFLHADPRAGVVRERLDAMLWNRRIVGLYRHPALVEAACPVQ